MKPLVAPTLILTLAVAPLFAQTRDAYEQSYGVWQQDDSNLVRDAAGSGKELTPRTEKAAADAGRFVSARKSFYEAQQAEVAAKVKALQPLELPSETDGVKAAEAILSPQETSIASSIELFGGDSDSGIQRLRQALEKERQALIMLKSAVRTRQNAVDTANEANDKVEHASKGAAAEVKTILASFSESSQLADQLAEAWPFYYRALSDGAQGVQTTAALPASLASLKNAEPNANAVPAAPVSRFVGSWSFVFGTSTYHGVSPFSFDVLVRERNGQLFGSVNARYIVTGNTDPSVQFNFSGPVQDTRSQSFGLLTANGISGAVDLIAGAAENQLEVNFHLDAAPGKIQESDVVLVKR